MSEISFGQPAWLALLPLALLVFGGWLVAGRRLRRRAGALTRASMSVRWLLPLALVLGIGVAAVAAAQPRWGERSATLRASGAQLVVVLDVSRSMDVADETPTRLGAARDELVETFDRLTGHRVGLVIFAGDALLRFPITADLDAAAQVVASVESGTVLVDAGTSAASGLDLAADAFDADADGGRLVLLVSDGDDLGGDPSGAAARLAAEGIDLLVAGAGSAGGGPVPVYDPLARSYVTLRDANGAPVVSRLNAALLDEVARAGGGRYLGNDLEVLPGVVSGRLASLVQASREGRTATTPIERFQWFAAVAVGLVVLVTLLEWARGAAGRRAAVGLVAAFALVAAGACATHAYELNEQALEAYETGDLEGAIALFFDAQAEEPNDGEIALNLSAALHEAERYEEAVRIARRALNDTDSGVVARAYASIGHHRFVQGDLVAAREAFRDALLLDPDDLDALHDYEVVLRLLSADPGTGDPSPGDGDGDGGDGPPPGEGDGGGETPGATPEPGDSGGEGGADPGGNASGGGLPGAPFEIDERIDAIDDEIAARRAEAGEEVSAEEALAILELLAERGRLAAQRTSSPDAVDSQDY